MRNFGQSRSAVPLAASSETYYRSRIDLLHHTERTPIVIAHSSIDRLCVQEWPQPADSLRTD